jgi:hypothetical protein
LLPPPDFSELSKAQIPVVNPALILAMARHRQILFEENNMEKLDVIKTVLGGEIQKVFNGTDDEKRERIYG